MKAMILAAGHGMRMRPLTKTTPKPLLLFQGRPMMEHLIIALAKAGVTEIIVNVSYEPKQFVTLFGHGEAYGLMITYVLEPADKPYNTGSALYNARDALGDKPFILVSGDIFTHYPFEKITTGQQPLESDITAHLVLVDNPIQNPGGDFGITEGYTDPAAQTLLTFSGIALIHPSLFSHLDHGYHPLGQLLTQAATAHHSTAEYYQGEYMNLTTPDQLDSTQ
jgi:MurNAc alpha-1-phosphate uridylyltransferase